MILIDQNVGTDVDDVDDVAVADTDVDGSNFRANLIRIFNSGDS